MEEFQEYKDQLPPEECDKIKEKVESVMKMLAEIDIKTPEEIKQEMADLLQASLKFIEMANKKMADDSEGLSSNSSSSEGSSDSESQGESGDSKKEDKN